MALVGLVLLAQPIEQAALGRAVGARRARPGRGCGTSLGPEDRALVGGRHVAARPVLGPADRPAGLVEHDHEAGQVLVLAAQAVGDPRAEAGVAAEDPAGVHHQHRRAVDRRLGVHRVDERDVVDARSPGAGTGRETILPHWP